MGTKTRAAGLAAGLLGWIGAGCAPATEHGDAAPRAGGEPYAASVHKALSSEQGFTAFETLQTRPLALSPNGKLLFAANTPDNRLEVFRVEEGGQLSALGSVSVGLEPTALAARSNDEVWVVNHLSDSVSVVKLDRRGRPRVERTLWVGDEPRDIVFAGANHGRAFISCAHRGQNGDDPQLFDAAAGRTDVWVFDAFDLGVSPGGLRLTKLSLFGDSPRALAASPDGSKVYVAPFASGNQTTVVSAEAVRQVYADAMDPDNPFSFTFLGKRTPVTGRIVKYQLGEDGQHHWVDDLGSVFDEWVRVHLPDYDVFTIDADALIPHEIASQRFAHAGTTLFNMAVNPATGKVYVSNTEAHNDVRFEGHNPTLPVTSVRGEIVDSRISVLDPATGEFTHNDLNSHVVDGVGDKSLSLAFPQDMQFSADGQTLAVVAQGSQKLALLSSADLEAGNLTPSLDDQVLLSAGGPAGVVLDEPHGVAYVLTRFDNGISTVNLASRSEVAHVGMFNPEPPVITEGRRFLYDATLTSESGTQACSACHVGGDKDELSWDLGNPGGEVLPIASLAAEEEVIFTASPAAIQHLVPTSAPLFEGHPAVKGPLTTQSLRGLDNHGSMHWRGDRNGAIRQDGTPFIDPATGAPVVSAQPDQGIFDEVRAFESFNVAFPGLVGSAAPLSPADMAAFTAFALELSYPPNPIRNLDDSLTLEQQAGRATYFQTNPDGSELPVDRLHNCNGCHTLDPEGNAGETDHPGFFGTSGRLSFENLPQIFKVAHFRNMYTRVGMFASAPDPNRSLTPNELTNPPLDAIRGFGYQPDGAVGSVEHHLTGRVFIRTQVEVDGAPPNPGGIPTVLMDPFTGQPTQIPDPLGFLIRRQLASFIMAYDSNLKPVVGQQVTLTSANALTAGLRVGLLQSRADAGDCALVVKARVDGRERGYLYADGRYVQDRAGAPSRTPGQLQSMLGFLGFGAQTKALTYTCVPNVDGVRIGLDRDGDGILDGDE